MTVALSLRTLVAGDGTVFPVGAIDFPEVGARQSTVPLLAGGVTFVGPDVSESSALGFEIHVLGADRYNCLSLVKELSAAWAPAADDLDLYLDIDGMSRAYRGRPLSCVPVLDGIKTATVRCSFTVRDGKWYAGWPSSISVAVANSSGGMLTPMDTPMVTTGSGSTGDVAIANYGTAAAPWTAYLFGPLTTPRLILGGKTVQIDRDIAAGSTVIVDSEDGSVLVDGAPGPWIAPSSEWWEIPPGASTFSFRAAAGSGSATLVWRDASY